VRRAAFAVFAAIACVLIVDALLRLLDGPGYRWSTAVVGVSCVVALEACRLKIGRIPYRSPSISLPVISLPVLAPAVGPETAIGVLALGVLVCTLVRTRRPAVALYAAGLAGAASTIAVKLFVSLNSAAAPAILAVVVAVAGYSISILVIEILRKWFARAPLAFDEPSAATPLRDSIAVIATAVVTGLVALWSEIGPLLVDDADERLNAIAVLLGVTVIAVLTKLSIRSLVMRRRLTGLIRGTADLNALSFVSSDGSNDVADLLCRAISDTIGAESVTVRDGRPVPGEIGVAVTADHPRFVVARRDPMDSSFTPDDRSALTALAHTANEVVSARENIGGLTLRANTDPLTGLPNYGAFQEALANINDNRNYSEALAVLFIDLDDFKRLNDRFGHQAGDEVLRGVGHRLRQSVRPYDVVARVGGDEFVIILTRLSSLVEAKKLAETVLAVSGEPLTVGQGTFSPVLSIGLAYSAHRETDVGQLVQDADQSMLAIKKSRRRGGPASEGSINISGHRSSQVNDIVARAIDEDLLELAYQPIVSIVSGQIWAFEALVRYTDPDLGPVSPPSLVEKAKSLGRLDALTRQVAVKAMAAAAAFRLVEPRIVCMTFNVEASQILPERVGSFVEDLANRYPGISLCLELNERSVARVSPAVRAQAEHLREIGLMIALDDYGSQDSSVDSLVRVPMDILKIDRSLVDDLDDVRQREVLTALQGFGDSLEYSMIVEGVENEAMVAHLRALGIRSAQGFHYGTPESYEKTLARLEAYGAAAIPAGRAAPPAPPPTVDFPHDLDHDPEDALEDDDNDPDESGAVPGSVRVAAPPSL